ncbi:unnamed protein product [Anisakis simplex]|uniref:Exocyst subunit Exo70 family protein n=1 Tax=Anisakis simplex TaxID=6269 RepID=A0A0M3JL78_ANISI|nr:unnamed protein product [Anisakis simplex]
MCRCSLDTILKKGLSQPVDSLQALIRTISVFYRAEFQEFNGLEAQSTALVMRTVSSVCMVLGRALESTTTSRFALFAMLNELILMVLEVDAFREGLQFNAKSLIF